MARQWRARASNQARTAARSSGVTGVRSFMAFLQSESLPMRAFLERGEHRGADRVDAAAEAEARQQPPPRRDHRQVHLGAIAGLQHAAQFTQAVDQPELQPALGGPELAGEQHRLLALELAAAPLAHPVLEAVMDLALQALEALDVLGVLVAKGIEHRLVLAGSVDPP